MKKVTIEALADPSAVKNGDYVVYEWLGHNDLSLYNAPHPQLLRAWVIPPEIAEKYGEYKASTGKSVDITTLTLTKK